MSVSFARMHRTGNRLQPEAGFEHHGRFEMHLTALVRRVFSRRRTLVAAILFGTAFSTTALALPRGCVYVCGVWSGIACYVSGNDAYCARVCEAYCD